MIGKDLAKEIKKIRGKIYVGMVTPHGIKWVFAEKQTLIQWAQGSGDSETGMKLFHEEDGVFLDVDYDNGEEDDDTC